MFSKYKSTIISIASTLFILFLFQCGAHITAPSIIFQNNKLTGLSQLLNLFGGGGLRKASVFAVGISPYITAQIIIQMLSNDVIKPLSELRKMGESGRYKMELYTRLLAFPFAIMTSIGTLHLLSAGITKFKSFDGQVYDAFSQLWIWQRILMVMLFVSGTYMTLFLSDIISKKGIGNGITLIIVSGIISGIPESFISAYNFFSADSTVIEEHKVFISVFKFIIYLFFYFLILLLIIFINGSVRKIPLQQIGAGLILQKDKLSYLPIKLMTAGIMPVVFAGSIMMFPVGIAELLKNKLPTSSNFVINYLSFNSISGLSVYSLLIILFSFFYSKIQINIDELTRNFQKNSQFIPGIRIGQQTYNYLNSVINYINCLGAPLLAIIAIMPNLLGIFAHMPPNIALGGTGIIIVVSGILQVYEEIKSNHMVSKYKIKSEITTENLNLKGIKSVNSDNLLW